MATDNKLSLSRRDFILSLLSGIAAAATLQGCGSPADTGQIAQRISQTIGDTAAAKRFGAAYLRDHPDDTGIEILLERIDEKLIPEFGQGMDLDDPQLLAQHLDKQIRNEYRHSEVVQVEGWILSRTEARLYALIALL